ncbi:MAG: hypothetical protein RMN51_01055 [Verrucomicrobiota bacterium]|nr:hypothetical protein [Limisphaera sp.]MDW8380687.1 hypothetical protein [Verrucomicrobiota bacterium]
MAIAVLASLLVHEPAWQGCSQTAEMRMACASIRFHQGTEPIGLFTLDLSSLPGRVNGELFPIFQATPYTHVSILTLTDQTSSEEALGNIILEVPAQDGDADGIPDFFEVNFSVQSTTRGSYTIQGYGRGVVEARWSRSAGHATGTCIFEFRLNAFQSLAVFTHTFELMEYFGPLRYNIGRGGVSATLSLARVAAEGSLQSAQVRLHRSADDPTHGLVFEPGAWLDEFSQIWPHGTNYLFRGDQPGNLYTGYFDFEDGWSGTPEADYRTWFCAVRDPNDSDGDGIPNLSDDPIADFRATRLWMRRAGTWLELGIEASAVPLSCQLLATARLDVPDWNVVLSAAVTNPSQVLLRFQPTGNAGFWRLRVY